MTHASAVTSSKNKPSLDKVRVSDEIGIPPELQSDSSRILIRDAVKVAASAQAKADLDLPSDALMAEDVTEVDSDARFSSALERLRLRSEALSQFAAGLKREYQEPQDEHSAPSFDGAEELGLHQVEARAERTYSSVEPVTEKDRPKGGLLGKGFAESIAHFFLQTAKQPDVFATHYVSFARELLAIAKLQSPIEPERADKRFRDAVWRDNVFYRVVMQAYLAWDREVSGWVEDLDMDEADRRRSRFIHEQVSALLSPTNSPLNPVAVKRAYQTGGLSVLDGVRHFLDDWKTNQGMPSQIRSDAFKVGVDLACTEGAVVYRSEVLELIQYKMEPGTAVQRRPVLIVPPQLNKFYVFDLTPKNSLVRHLQSQGVQPFIISWRNPTRHNGEWDLDCYVTELEKSIEAMLDITGADKINLTSACAGGLTSMALLGYLAAANKPLVHSHSLFVTALQADDSSLLGLFATREGAELSRKISAKMGYMDGKTLSHIFNWLRPTDLVWNYWINNYLLGKEPPSMDVLYWDNDSTRLPAGLHSNFLDIFIQDAFANPGTLMIKGHSIDIRQIAMDFYCVGGDEDYLMPWKKCFEVPDLLNTRCTFVLSTSGHIQSILRPPGIGNTYYYVNDSEVRNADQWLATATKREGSWWLHWGEWLAERGGHKKVVGERLGSDKYPPLSPAPGLYVNERAA